MSKKIQPVGDVFMVEVGGSINNPMGLQGAHDPDEGVREGIVVGISDDITYFGMNTFAFDSSLMDEAMLEDIYDRYKEFLGKKVYWPERSESGTVIEYDGKKYAFVKWSVVMAVESDD